MAVYQSPSCNLPWITELLLEIVPRPLLFKGKKCQGKKSSIEWMSFIKGASFMKDTGGIKRDKKCNNWRLKDKSILTRSYCWLYSVHVQGVNNEEEQKSSYYPVAVPYYAVATSENIYKWPYKQHIRNFPPSPFLWHLGGASQFVIVDGCIIQSAQSLA